MCFNKRNVYLFLSAAYVLAEPGKGNKLEIAASETTAGPTVSCFLSPIHALIEANVLDISRKAVRSPSCWNDCF